MSKTFPKNSWLTEHPLYTRWEQMKQRCNNPRKPEYKYYGGRGIKVCDRWNNSFINFKNDVGMPPEDGYTLERIDNDGDYTPKNVRWATVFEQVDNMRRAPASNDYYGVSWSKAASKWYAYANVSGKRIYLGLYQNKQDAAIAHDMAIIQYGGIKSTLNFL